MRQSRTSRQVRLPPPPSLFAGCHLIATDICMCVSLFHCTVVKFPNFTTATAKPIPANSLTITSRKSPQTYQSIGDNLAYKSAQRVGNRDRDIDRHTHRDTLIRTWEESSSKESKSASAKKWHSHSSARTEQISLAPTFFSYLKLILQTKHYKHTPLYNIPLV